MRHRPALQALLLCGLLLHALCADAAQAFGFGVIAHPAGPTEGEVRLRTALAETDADNLAFVVVNGIKAADEPCSDRLYLDRRALLNDAQNGVVMSLAASDWAGCRDEDGRSAAIGRLARMRELFFPEQFSFGASRIPLVTQSANARFRMYPENARWEIGDVAFATVDLPANNNDYRFEAGRNSEFEDRLIADRNWLHQIFTYAKYRKLRGIVLFCDGNPLAPRRHSRRDGYAEIRRQLNALAAGFSGKVLIVHGEPARDGTGRSRIGWHGRLGEVGIGADWIKLKVDPALPELFAVAGAAQH